jgi:putative multiple sugar transport system substrate-binding protein
MNVAGGRRRFGAVAIAAALGLASAGGAVGVADGATVTRLWQARIGPTGVNGSSILQVDADRTGSLTLRLSRFRASTTLQVVISRGACASVGARLLVAPSVRTTTTGTVARTIPLGATLMAPIAAAARSGVPLAIRVRDPNTGVVRCGAFAVAPLTIGVVLPTFVQGMAYFDVAESTIGTAGYRAQVLYSRDVATERADVDALIGRGAKVVILFAQDGTAAAAAVGDARAAGVKTIAYDRPVRGTASLDYLVSFDNLAVGRAQAQYLVDRAGATKGDNLYLYAGPPTDANAFAFLEGAWELLQPKIADGTFVIRNSPAAVGVQGNPTLTRDQLAAIIAEVNTGWDPATARALAARQLAALGPAEKGTAFVLAPNDGTARALWDAFDADLDVTTAYITGQDADKASVQAIIDGRQGMTVLKDHRALWSAAIAAAAAFLARRPPVENATYDNGVVTVPARLLPIVAVTRQNVQATLIDTGYFRASDFTGTWPGKH